MEQAPWALCLADFFVLICIGSCGHAGHNSHAKQHKERHIRPSGALHPRFAFCFPSSSPLVFLFLLVALGSYLSLLLGVDLSLLASLAKGTCRSACPMLCFLWFAGTKVSEQKICRPRWRALFKNARVHALSLRSDDALHALIVIGADAASHTDESSAASSPLFFAREGASLLLFSSSGLRQLFCDFSPEAQFH